MTARTTETVQTPVPPSAAVTTLRPGLLQRKCACGGSSGSDGECESCRAGKSQISRRAVAPPATAGKLRAPGHHFAAIGVYGGARPGPAAPVSQAMSLLPISEPGDASEREADQAAERVAGSAPGVGPVVASPEPPSAQRQAPGGAPSSGQFALPPAMAQAIQHPHGGRPLAADVRGHLEPRFGADFSGVRLHTGPDAAALAGRLHARAFTYRSDIWLGAGQRADDLPLMAHELTHVLQQSAGLSRGEDAPGRSTGRAVLQRSGSYYGFTPPSGKKAHDEVEKSLGQVNSNVFFEVGIPGATRMEVSDYKTGWADFYKGSTTIGVEFKEDKPDPQFLEPKRTSMLGKAAYPHNAQAAPAGMSGAPAGACGLLSTGTNGVCRLDKAPPKIQIGELKPPDGAETVLGVGQVGNYIKGIKGTATKIGSYVSQNPGQALPANATPWSPTVDPMDKGDITIPPKHDKSQPESARGKKYQVYAFYRGSMLPYAYARLAFLNVDFSGSGVWTYEFEPSDKKELTAQAAAIEAKQAPLREKLKKVKAPITTEPKVSGKRAAVVSVRPAGPPRVQRKQAEDTFNLDDWKTNVYEGWHKEASPYPDSTDAQQVEAMEVEKSVAERTGRSVQIPRQEEGLESGLRDIRLWSRYGIWFGRLRKLFGTTFVKAFALYDKVRTKVREWLDKQNESGDKSSGLAAVIFRTAFTMVKQFLSLLVNRVVNELVTAVGNGVKKVIQDLFGPAIAKIEEKIEEVKQTIEDFEKQVEDKFVAVFENVFGPVEGYMEKIREVQKIVGVINDVITMVQWAVRVAACLQPPGLGCLWGIFGGMAINKLIEFITGTCWFRRSVMLPLFKVSDFIRKLPKTIANFILDGVRGLIPAGLPMLRDLFPAIEIPEAELEAKDAECDPDASKDFPQSHRDMIDLYRDFGQDTVDALVRFLIHRGVARKTAGGVTSADAAAMLRNILAKGYTKDDFERGIRETPEIAFGNTTVSQAVAPLKAASPETGTTRGPSSGKEGDSSKGVTVEDFSIKGRF